MAVGVSSPGFACNAAAWADDYSDLGQANPPPFPCSCSKVGRQPEPSKPPAVQVAVAYTAAVDYLELEAHQHLQIAEPRAATVVAAAMAGAGVGGVAFLAQIDPLLGLVPAAFGIEEACTAWKAGAHHPCERELVRHHFVAGDQCC